jgi:hypothetical protein
MFVVYDVVRYAYRSGLDDVAVRVASAQTGAETSTKDDILQLTERYFVSRVVNGMMSIYFLAFIAPKRRAHCWSQLLLRFSV